MEYHLSTKNDTDKCRTPVEWSLSVIENYRQCEQNIIPLFFDGVGVIFYHSILS